MSEGRVIWITGLSGAGKTTLARMVAGELRARGRSVVLLDGDELREVLGQAAFDAGHHTRSERLALAMRYSRLCAILSAQGLWVVIATISMFREVQEWNRAQVPGYFEVFMKVPLEELRRRDPKGIYKDFDQRRRANVAGLDLAVDEPERPDFTVFFDTGTSPEVSSAQIVNHLTPRNE